MIVETIECLKKNPFGIKIKGRGLLYSVDLQGFINREEETIVFNTSGQLRFGVLTSPGKFLSRYRITDSAVSFLEHSIEFPKIGFLEKYWYKGSSVQFVKNKQNERPVEGWVQPLMDPLPLVYKMMDLQPAENIDYFGPLLVDGKQKALHFTKMGLNVKVELGEKVLFEGQYKGSSLNLTIPKFKMKLEINRT